MVLEFIVPAVGAGLGLIGQSQSDSANRAAQQKAINQQYKYDKELYEFNWDKTKREYKYRKEEVQNQRDNNEAQLYFQEQSALDQYEYSLAIRAFQYQQQVDLFNKSEEIFGRQTKYNIEAARNAIRDEVMQFTEIHKGLKFEAQAAFVDMLQNAGTAGAKGLVGNSVNKGIGAVMASYGRDQAVMAEELTSARSQMFRNLDRVGSDFEQAMINADANRRLKPKLAPDPIAPRPLPRPNLLDPLKPERPPEPVKGVNTYVGQSPLTYASSALGIGANLYGNIKSLQAPNPLA